MDFWGVNFRQCETQRIQPPDFGRNKYHLPKE